jgi:hypothetical protein
MIEFSCCIVPLVETFVIHYFGIVSVTVAAPFNGYKLRRKILQRQLTGFNRVTDPPEVAMNAAQFIRFA